MYVAVFGAGSISSVRAACFAGLRDFIISVNAISDEPAQISASFRRNQTHAGISG
jgi:hypothetical protein